MGLEPRHRPGAEADAPGGVALLAPPGDAETRDAPAGGDIWTDEDEEALWAWRGCTLVPTNVTGRETVERALAQAPDLVLAAAVASLDLADLAPETRVDVVSVWERLAAWVNAQQQRALASVVAATEDIGLDGDMARHEVGVALRLSPGTAYDRVKRAQALTGRLAGTLGALERGAISPLQATAIAEAVERLDDQTAAAVEARVLGRASGQTVAETRRALRRAVIAADPAGATERAEQARAERTIYMTPLDDGMTELHAILTATDAQLVWRRLCARAEKEGRRLAAGGARSPGSDALRADALVAAVVRAAADPPADPPVDRPAERDGAVDEASTVDQPVPVDQWAPTQLRVTVDLPTLLGLADHPAELEGYGAIPPAMARALSGDAEWVRWTTDPQTGRLLDLGRRRYRPSRPLAAFVRARDAICVWPGCHRPSEQSDLDHTVDFADGGETTRRNLAPLCRQHHNAKTHGRWQYRRDPDGTGHLTSPLGKTYAIPPPWHAPDG